MADRELIWVVVNTNSTKEADKIGMAVLEKRLCACYGIIPRIKSVYYWPPRLARQKGRLASPPKTSKLEISKGPLLTLETLPKHYSKITKLVKSLHSDKVPFIGQWEMENVEKDFYKWLKREIE
ncbi:MAG: divalent cation tolerance protein CutA [Patescibacteria group bacterium]